MQMDNSKCEIERMTFCMNRFLTSCYFGIDVFRTKSQCIQSEFQMKVLIFKFVALLNLFVGNFILFCFIIYLWNGIFAFKILIDWGCDSKMSKK